MKKNVDEKINRINATMELENMKLTELDKQRIRDIEEGKSTVEEEINKLKNKYQTMKK